MISHPLISSWMKIAFIFLVLLAGSCSPISTQTPVSVEGADNPVSTTEPAETTHAADDPARPTMVFAFKDQPELDESDSRVELPTPAPDPLRFVFPTVQAAPVSAWRPPLYPAPLALSPYDHFYFYRPIAADQINWPSQDYRYGGEFFQDIVHTGVDIPAPKGTPVLAAGSGKVIWAGYGVYRGGYDTSDPYGLAVTIRHDFGYQGQTLYSIYGHLADVDVIEGQIVKAGEMVGIVGETGKVTGPHLHFEVRVGDNSFFSTRNPELWIVPPIGWGVLAGQIMDSNSRLVEAQQVVITSSATGQNWFSKSYGSASPANPDPYYQENITIGDLPAGKYLIRLSYAGRNYAEEIRIAPGRVSYFYFYGRAGIVIAPPPQADTYALSEPAPALDK